MVMKAKELGVDLDDRAAAKLSEDLKQLEADGFVFEAADASLELLMREATGWKPGLLPRGGLPGHHLPPGPGAAAATKPADRHRGHGEALGRRRAAHRRRRGQRSRSTRSTRPCGGVLVGAYPHLAHIHLTDYRVRILDTEADTDAVVRVLIDSTDGDLAWTTIGVSTNIIEASWQALIDALVWGLLHSGQ